jgi:hypothetical protein
LDKAKPDTGNTRGLNLAGVMFTTVQVPRLPLWRELLVSIKASLRHQIKKDSVLLEDVTCGREGKERKISDMKPKRARRFGGSIWANNIRVNICKNTRRSELISFC